MEHKSSRNCVSFRTQTYKVPGKVSGFTFLGLLILIAIMGVGLLAVGEVWHFAKKREKEDQLLYVGNQFREAIKSFYFHTPTKIKGYPMALEDLIKDPRYLTTQRYLRQIYPDPITGKTEWGIVKSPNGGIIGVYSQSDDTPIKQDNFKADNIDFTGKSKYSDWHFVYIPPQNLNTNKPTN